MKKTLISVLFIFSGLSSFASSDSKAPKLFDRMNTLKAMSENPLVIKDTELNCDTRLIRNWIDYLEQTHSNVYSHRRMRQAYPLLCEELRGDADINLAFVKLNINMFELVDPTLVTNYDELALNVVKEKAWAIKYVKPEGLSSREFYGELALIAVAPEYFSRLYEINLKYINPEFVNNYDELVIKGMKYSCLNIEDVAQEDIYNLEDTKREALLKELKSIICSRHPLNRFIETISGPCTLVKSWLKDYNAFKKKQEEE
jgi:hypothetical protein